MTTTRRPPYPDERMHASSHATLTPATMLEQQRRLVQQYLTAVDEARRYERQALERLRAALTALDERARLAGGDGWKAPLEPAASPRRARQDRRRRARRRALALLLVIAVALAAAASGAWWLLRDEPAPTRTTSDTATAGSGETASQPSGSDAHAGHHGSTDAAPVKLAPGSDINVELGEFFVRTDYGKVRSGEITFHIANEGKAEHELMIADADDLTVGQIARMTHDEIHDRVIGATHGITAGSTDKTLTVDLEPGRYILFCNLPGHLGGGQHMVFRVA